MKKLFMWIIQLVGAVLVLQAGVPKIQDPSGFMGVFTQLGMGQFGILLIGSLELLAGLLLFTNYFAVYGALLAFSIMLGAVIAHLTALNGLLSDYHLMAIFVASLTVMILRKEEVPLFPTKETGQ